MKQVRTFLALLLVAALLAGCQKQTPSASQAVEPPVAEPPLAGQFQQQPVPDFLDQEQQQIFLHGFCAAGCFLLGCSTWGVEEFPLADGSQPHLADSEEVELDGRTYVVAQGRYRQWVDFQAMLDALFTPEYQQELIDPAFPRFRSTQDGLMCFIDESRGSDLEYDWCETPDSYELTSQTEDEICFDLIGHYTRLDYEGDMPEPIKDYTQRFPIRMVRTQQGWRVAEIHVPW